jgi:ribosome-associated protein
MQKEKETECLLRVCCQALSDKKAEEIKVLKMGELSSLADYFIIASGKSNPHLKAIHREIDSVLKEIGSSVYGKERFKPSGWIVVDVIDVVVHIFSPEARSFYALESLWKDAENLDPNQIIQTETNALSDT